MYSIYAVADRFLAGMGVGGLTSWLLWQARYQTVRERAKHDLIAERATMVEQLHHKDGQLADLRQQQQRLQADLPNSTRP